VGRIDIGSAPVTGCSSGKTTSPASGIVNDALRRRLGDPVKVRVVV
jgi:hypothetical protein